MNVEQVTTTKGLNVLYVEQPDATAGSVQMWFRAGSALEKKADFGVAHFLEHMFFKGTKKRPGAKIAEEVEGFGGELNAFTSFDFTCYYINCPKSQLSKSVDIILDMVANPQFLNSELIPERGVVLEEYKRSIDSPSQYAFTELQDDFFSGGYKHQILGTEKNIYSFTRDQIIKFRKKYYNKENALLVVAGDLKNKNKIEKLIEKFSLPSGQKSTFSPFKLQSEKQFSGHLKEVGNSTLQICFEASDYDSKEAVAEELALSLIGHGESSYLGKKLVYETNLANAVHSSPLYMARNGIYFLRINFPSENLSQVLKTLGSELNSILKNKIKPEDIEKAKFQGKTSKIYDLETIEAYAFSLGNGFAQNGDIRSENKFIDRQQNVSAQEVRNAMKKILADSTWYYQLQLPMNQNLDKSIRKVSSFDKKLKVNLKKIKTLNKVSGAVSKYNKQTQVNTILPGIKLVHRHSSLSNTFNLQVYIKGGLTEETPNSNGTFNLLTGLLNADTKNKTKDESKFLFESLAASFSTFSGKNAYGLNLSGICDKFSELTEQFFDHLLHSTFNQKDLDFEKLMVQQSLLAQKEDPVRQCFDEVSRIAFGDHPYSMKNMGTLNSIKNTKISELKELHEKNLSEKNLLFVYSGPLDIDNVTNQIKGLISPLEKRANFQKTKVKKYRPSKTIKTHLEFDREQSHVFIGKPTNKLESTSTIYFKLIHTYLYGQSSPLFTEMRDKKGLCYSVSPINFNALEGGYFGIYVGCSNEKVSDSIQEINRILKSLRENGLTKSNFKKLIKMSVGQFELSLQTNEDYCNTFATPYLHGIGLDYYFEEMEKIKNLNHEDFQQGVKKALGGKFFEVISGTK